ncbi:MAG: glycoside hydrolase family 3 N-terminal domain-containing protein [Bacteroidota bacterium]
MKKILFVLGILSHTVVSAQQPLYKDPKQPVDTRVEDLLKRMTPEEKFWQLFMIPGDLSNGKDKYKNGIFGFQVSASAKENGAQGQLLQYNPGSSAKEAAEKMNAIQKFFVEESRLGIPVIFFDEALHGLVREDATLFPQSIALAATFDTALMHDVAAAIALEAKSRGIRQILSPVLNIARDVRWGRTEETYGEDPYLVSLMAHAYISELEKVGVIATPKHFAVNSGDGGRDSYPIHYNERLLEEIYFPAFKMAVQDGHARSIMTAYNSLDGSPCSANDWLLNKKLKSEWGFQGFVISDAGATGGANVLHMTAKDYAESTVNSLNGGLDVIFQTSYDHYPHFWKAFSENRISSKVIDDAVRRVLRAKFELGLFENPYVDPAKTVAVNNQMQHRMYARAAAMKSIVLLKNENNTLPLKKTITSIAVIGKDADTVNPGGYGGPGVNNISVLEGLKKTCKDQIKLNYAPGCGHLSPEYKTIPSECLYPAETLTGKHGLNASYFNNISFEGQPTVTRVDPQIDFAWTLFSPDPALAYDWYSIEWTGILKAPQSGNFKIGIEGNDGYKLYINDKLISERWTKETNRVVLKDFLFEKDKSYKIKIQYYESTGNARLRLVWNIGVNNDWKQKINDAVSVAKKSDVAIVVVGIEEGEFRDRALLNLPGHQEEMIKAVAATGKPTIVLLNGGSAITMNNWIDDADAILNIWYPGEEGGMAVADILFGAQNPAGRLPITYPVHEGQLPLVYNHKPTGRGDDYNNLTGQPLFPFGFGLSYTSFSYSDLKIDNPSLKAGDTCYLHFKLKNTGAADGDEVVQLYIRDEFSSVARPLMELKSFQRVFLKMGEEKTISMKLTPATFSMLDKDLKIVIEPGDFRVMIGASSKDIRLRGIIKAK